MDESQRRITGINNVAFVCLSQMLICIPSYTYQDFLNLSLDL